MATYSLTSPHNTTFEVLKRMFIALSPFLLPNNFDISPTGKMFRGIVAQIGADREFLQKRAQAMDEWHGGENASGWIMITSLLVWKKDFDHSSLEVNCWHNLLGGWLSATDKKVKLEEQTDRVALFATTSIVCFYKKRNIFREVDILLTWLKNPKSFDG